MTTHPNFPGLLQAFFTERLLQQRRASPETIAGYRDCFRLLLRFAAQRLGSPPSKLSLGELDAPFIGEFLDHLESKRSNGARTRNTRLAAIHSFFRYVSFQEPSYADLCRRVLAIPSKRYDRKQIEYLGREEIDALVATPDTTTWIGRRDRALLLTAIQTGLRASELIGLQRQAVVLGPELTFAARERAESSDVRPYARKWLELWRCGSASAPASPTHRSSPAVAAAP